MKRQRQKTSRRTPLCEIACKYGTDKCPQIGHNYTPIYYDLLKDRRESVKKVLELGIGTPDLMTHVDYYRTGASLYMWRDFFPNAQIFGADYLESALFEDDRIQTRLCDERKADDLTKLIQWAGADIDLFVDDADHFARYQIATCKTVMPLLKKEVLYIIEDAYHPRFVSEKLSRCGYTPETLAGSLILVRQPNG